MSLRWISAAAVLLGALLAGFVLFVLPRTRLGAEDDVVDVDLQKVMASAKRASDAYHDPETFRREYGEHVEVGEFPVSKLRIYIDSNPGGEAQWVILRGTANMGNVFDDLDFVLKDEHELGINVHAGFDKILQECLPWVLERLNRSRPVRLTGHSLGGSVAALLLATLDRRGFEDVSAITFGQPKFTDAHGAAKLAHLEILRVVHDNDPVPLVPPLTLESGDLAKYHHFGPEIVVMPSGHFYYLPRHCSTRMDITEFWENIVHIKPMSHDMITGYLPALKRALEREMARLPAPEEHVDASVRSNDPKIADAAPQSPHGKWSVLRLPASAVGAE
jgi:hypothetical protein